MRATKAALALTLASPLYAQQPALQVDWIQNPSNGSWYGVEHALRTWQDQQTIAEGIGGNLVTIRSQAEHDWIISNLFTPYAQGGSLHIGASDAIQEGTWTWASGEPFSFTRWDPGQPDDFAGIQDYSVLSWNYGGNWDDVDGTATRRGILEARHEPGVGWSWPKEAQVNGRPFHGCVADLDGDGHLDYASPGANGVLTILLGSGDGTWTVANEIQVSGGPRQCIAIDHDQDGLLEVVVTCALGQSLLLIENPAVQATTTVINIASGEEFYGLADGDFNNDGLSDIVVTDIDGADQVLLFFGHTAGGFTGPSVLDTLTSAYDPTTVVVSDINNDGHEDILVACEGAGAIRTYEGSGDGTYALLQEVATGDLPLCPSVADLNSDGWPDLIVPALLSNQLEIRLNAGSGLFAGAQVQPAGSWPHWTAAEDLDGDGHVDVVVTAAASNEVLVFRGDGLGSLQLSEVFEGHQFPRACHLADINSDGTSDLVVAAYDDDSIITWTNNYFSDCNGNGVADVTDISSGSSSDCNGNGIPDECDLANGLDCNGNGIPDSCDIASGSALDCNNNGIPDDCDIANDPTVDANLNSVPDSCEVAGSRYWILSPVTGNWYAVTDELDVTQAQLTALNWGGHLATIDDQAENDWLAATFGDASTPIWTGFNDANIEGSFEWVSGAASGFTAWDTATGQPDNAPGVFGGADFAVLEPVSGLWYDEPADATSFAPGLPRGVVELVSSDCDTNGIPDTYELLQDPSLDCDGNGIHDLCDLQDPALDCDGNGVLDSCQIAADPSLDCDGNGAIDSCEIIADTSLDCDADQTLDVCQITADPSLDWNGDGYIDTCANGSIVYCVSNPNAAGLRGLTQPQGSPVIADDNFTLRAHNLPIGQPGMFLMSRSTGLVNPFGGGAGVLCLGPPIRRFAPIDGFPLQFTSSSGELFLSPSVASFPDPVPVQPGEVIHFQLWHREFDPASGAPRSNTSEGISVMFR